MKRKPEFTPHLLRGTKKAPPTSSGKGAGFINCKVNVSERVFTPRIETEFWVRKAIGEIKKIKKPVRVLDIFSGTGCIGIAVLKAIKNAEVSFIDIDKEAIEQIKINLKLNKIPEGKYRIYQSNLFEKFTPHQNKFGAGIKDKKFDIIFANPPYVAVDRIYEVDKEVFEKEPHVALFAGKDGMFYIEKFLKQVKKYLKPSGKIFLEFDPFQKKEIETILKNKGFKFVFKKDQFGKHRWLRAGIF